MIAIEKRRTHSEYRHVEVNGTGLAYIEQGSGEPLIFVHGGICDLTFWEPILEPVGSRFRAISYSRRWAWPNEPIPADVVDSVDVHAEDLIALIEKLGAGPVNLVGNSFGAFISLLVARDRPDLVRRLVAQEPPVMPLLLGFPPSPPALIKLLLTRPRVGVPLAKMVFGGVVPVEKMVERGDVEASIEKFVRSVALGDAGYDALPDWIKEHMRLNAGTHAAQFRNNGGFAPFTPADARSISIPTLVMTGQHSPAALRVLSAELARYLPNARTIEIPDASHAMHLANPEATVNAIEGFLGRD
ncbi:MAG TPA: alpha/beta hydrolase [Candidatus Dormibacteraeota bacterium]